MLRCVLSLERVGYAVGTSASSVTYVLRWAFLYAGQHFKASLLDFAAPCCDTVDGLMPAEAPSGVDSAINAQINGIAYV